ncbi:MAG: DUF47 family protein, partial [Candidatus Micrarchaeota archaeon]
MKRIISFLLPKEILFFDLFEKQAENATQASCLLRDFLKVYDGNGKNGKRKWLGRINDMEKRGDDITREIIENLHKTFITPIDHE